MTPSPAAPRALPSGFCSLSWLLSGGRSLDVHERWFCCKAVRVTWSEQGKGVREIPLQHLPRSRLLRRPPTNGSFVLRSLSRTSKYSSLRWQQAKQNQSELEDDQCGVRQNGACGLSHLAGVISVPGQVPLASGPRQLQSGIVRHF